MCGRWRVKSRLTIASPPFRGKGAPVRRRNQFACGTRRTPAQTKNAPGDAGALSI
jgi:hypothetical protein